MNIVDFLVEKLVAPKSIIEAFILTAPHRYKTYEVTKRNGSGKREIAQPSKELKYVQKLILGKYDLMQDLPIHKAAMAYRKNIGIQDNAFMHKDNQYVLKMDFSNFFPSIAPSDLISHIEKHKKIQLDDKETKNLGRLFFYAKEKNEDLVLSIGAPSSPYISNTLMYDFDVLVQEICDKNKVVYSRYADDLTFSTNTKDVLFKFPELVEGMVGEIMYPGLLINNKKTVFLSKGTNRNVTGLVISNEGNVTIGRDKKRIIKSMVYKYSQGQLEPENEIPYLKGYLNYINGVEPSFLLLLETKYGVDLVNAIRSS